MKHWQGIVVAQPNTFLLGGVKILRSSWYLDKQEVKDWLYAASDQPNARYCVLTQDVIKSHEL